MGVAIVLGSYAAYIFSDIIALFHSPGTEPTDNNWVKSKDSGLARYNSRCLKRRGGSPSGPEERFGFSLFIANIMLVSVKVTVSSVQSDTTQGQCGTFPSSTTPVLAKYSLKMLAFASSWVITCPRCIDYVVILQSVPPRGGVKQRWGGKTRYFEAKCVNISKTVGYTSKVTIND